MGWLNKYSGTTTTDTTIPNSFINKKSKTENKKGLGFSDEDLLKQAWKESSFRPKVKNSLGYMGLAQVGDEAIHDYKKAHNLKTFDPYDPTSAKKIQRWYMDKAYNSGLVTNPTQTEENRKLKALAYYNYGPGNLRKVLREAKSKNIDTYKSDKWLDLLPQETREYGNKILGKDEKFNREFDSVRALPKYNKIVETYVPKAQEGRKERFSKIDPSKIYTSEEQKQLLRKKKIKEKTALLKNNLAEAQNRKAFNQSNETARLQTLRDNFQEAQNHPLWYLPGSISPFGAVEDLAINGLGRGFKYLKGLKQVKAPLKPKAINKPKDAITKSEIDWGKWNKEIPENKELMQEYNAIEQKAKADGTWMKNSKGEEFKGTPEQFIQVNSKRFKEAFKDGFSNVYRGASKHNPLLINHKDYKSVFTGDKDLANGYTGIGGKDRFYTSDLDLHDTGIHELAMRNSSNSVEFDAVRDDWLDLQFLERNEATFEKNIAANKKHLDRLIKTKPEAKTIIKHTKRNIQDLEKGYENYKIALENPNYKNMAEYFDGIHSYSDGISTDDIASYLDQSFLDNISIKNVLDGDFGDVHINRQKPGNYLKSLRGNNGMFDMSNPNIYKAVVPGAIGTAAASQATNSFQENKQFKNGGKVKKKWLNKYQDGGKIIEDTKNQTNKKAYNWEEIRKTRPSFSADFMEDGEDDFQKNNRKLARESVDNSSVNYLNSYYNSDVFKERFKINNSDAFTKYGYDNNSERKEYAPIIKKSVDEAYKKYQPYVLEEDPNYIGSRVTNNRFNPIFGAPVNTTMLLSKPQARRLNSDLFNEILPHEYTHSARDLTKEDEFMLSMYSFDKNMPEYRKEYDQYLKDNNQDSFAEIFPYGKNTSFSSFLKDDNIPKKNRKENLHNYAPNEIHADLDSLRYNLFKEGIYDTRKGDMSDEQYEEMISNSKIRNNFMFKRLKKHYPDKHSFLKIMNTIAQNKQNNYKKNYAKHGKIIEDNRGQWAHPGEVTKINSNNITMKGVNYPVLGISDTGDTQMMYPNGEYQYDGKSVTEYPMAQDGKTIKLNEVSLKGKSSKRKTTKEYKKYLESVKKYNDSLYAFDKQNELNSQYLSNYETVPESNYNGLDLNMKALYEQAKEGVNNHLSTKEKRDKTKTAAKKAISKEIVKANRSRNTNPQTQVRSPYGDRDRFRNRTNVLHSGNIPSKNKDANYKTPLDVIFSDDTIDLPQQQHSVTLGGIKTTTPYKTFKRTWRPADLFLDDDKTKFYERQGYSYQEVVDDEIKPIGSMDYFQTIPIDSSVAQNVDPSSYDYDANQMLEVSLPFYKKPTTPIPPFTGDMFEDGNIQEFNSPSRKKIQPLGLNSKGLRNSQIKPESKFAGLEPEIAYWDVVEEVNQNFGGNKRTKKVYRQDEIDRIKRKQAADENSFTGKNNKISIKPRITGWLEKYNK